MFLKDVSFHTNRTLKLAFKVLCAFRQGWGRGSGFCQIRIRGTVPRKRGDLKNSIKWIFYTISKYYFFGFQTFGVRCPRSVKPARIRQNSDWIQIRIQGSTAYRGRLAPFLKHSLPIVIKISFRSRYRAPDPDPKNRILTPAFRLCLPWQVKHIFFYSFID